MRHFDTSRWADFVRGTIEPGKRSLMQRHLDAGCGRCGRTVAVLRRVVAEARAEAAPPDYAVRSVKAFFALNRPQRESLLQKLVLQSTFDSRLEVARVQIRGDDDDVRHLRLESDGFLVDLRLERNRRLDTTRVEGQIVHRDGQPMANAPTYLVADGAVSPGGFTDGVGGFGLDLPSGVDAQIWLGADATRLIVAELPVNGPLR